MYLRWTKHKKNDPLGHNTFPWRKKMQQKTGKLLPKGRLQPRLRGQGGVGGWVMTFDHEWPREHFDRVSFKRKRPKKWPSLETFTSDRKF